MDIIVYGMIANGEETSFCISYLGNGDWEIQVGDSEPFVMDDLEEAMRILKEQNPD